MIIAFLDTGSLENEYFERELKDHDLFICDSLEDCPAEAEALSVFVNSKIDASVLKAHKALRLIVTRSQTVDHIDLQACVRRGVTVSNVGAGYGENTVPEHVFALLLALSRRLRVAFDMMAGRGFTYENLRGIELHGRTLGVVGTGRIGRQVLRLAKAFGMTTLGCDTHRDKEAAAALGFRYVKFSKMLELADYISVNVPLTPSTYHLFNRETFARCKRGLILVNTARGPVIESEALIEALDSGIVAGAGLDVLEDERVMRKRADHILTDQILAHLQSSFAPVEPLGNNTERVTEVRSLLQNSTLLSHPNVIVTPHIGFNSYEAVERINRTTVENIMGFAAGTPRNVVAAKARKAMPRRTAM